MPQAVLRQMAIYCVEGDWCTNKWGQGIFFTPISHFGAVLSPPVLMHGGLICITFCLSRCHVWSPQDAFVGCKSHYLGTGGVQTDSWGVTLICGLQPANWHADIASKDSNHCLYRRAQKSSYRSISPVMHATTLRFSPAPHQHFVHTHALGS